MQDHRFATAKVAVVGAGCVGASLARHLERLGFRHVEFFESRPGIAERLRDRYVVHAGDFWDTLTLGRLCEYDFAVCTVDDPRVRRRMNQKCLLANVDLVLAWAEDGLAIASAFPFGTLPDCACFDCDASRVAKPMPLASLKLSAGDEGIDEPLSRAAPTIAGALGAAVLARVAAGSHGSVARVATLDTRSGEGASIELRRDPDCARCRGLARPVPIVQTRNRWAVSSCVATTSPETLDQSIELSDPIEDLPGRSFRVGELVERFGGGAIPAKFALTIAAGRVVCLDFEDFEDR